MDNNITREHSRYSGQNIKQADVNLLAYPLKTIKDEAQIRRDLEFYKALIPN
jgi:trehalose/maltose hydrolase-like predicted phosphorylase